MELPVGRRAFLTLLGGAGAAWLTPLNSLGATRARTIGFLMGLGDDSEARARIKVFENGLARRGWRLGSDVRIEYRFSGGDDERAKVEARNLVAMKPDLIVGHSTPAVAQLFNATKAIPIVFIVVADPVGSGFVASMARPGGNITGFTNQASTITGKLLTILKQLMPNLKRVALLYSPVASIDAGLLFLQPLEAAAPHFNVRAIQAQALVPADIERHMTELSREKDVGLIVTPDNFTTINRQLIIDLAARLRIPTVYPYRFFAEAGGLMSYGVDVKDLFNRSAEYASRILRGENPAELPVQAPTKFELVINLKTAKALGLTVPKILLAGADALIE